MKAWQFSEVSITLEESLVLARDAEMPNSATLGPTQMIVQVLWAALNPVDYKLPESGLIGRLMIPRPAVPGLDFCGRVYAKHADIDTFEQGQIIFGGLARPSRFGTLGEYALVSTTECAPLPRGVKPEHAAAIGTAATTAYQSIPASIVKPGARVFINGGSGGVGTWAVQFAKARGAYVVTTCSTKNVDRCSLLGADEVLDYTNIDLVDHLKSLSNPFDILVDNVGNDTNLYRERDALLNPNGMFVQVGVGKSVSLNTVVSTGSKQLRQYMPGQKSYYFVNQENKAEYFKQIGLWMAEGKVRAFIDTRFSYDQVPDAFRELRRGHTADKLVIRVTED
ncbi:Ff.00g055100.m01.CDS01 [Fusarium sp. VM40]|nr:Ff.00g055100.m01.CDS01 [Fusarium sp. VM40]